MGLGHSPRIVTDGMVLCLDAANPKNFNLTEVEVLVVAGGGGGGGGDVGSGGGAGGLIYNSNFAVTPGTQLTVTVGAGGAGSSTYNIDGSNGSPSVFGSLEAIGGGGGASWSSGTGQDGGSGGGGVGGSAGGFGTAGQGFAGGTGVGFPDYPQGGGGGAGGPGQTATNHTRAGDGGIGLSFPQFSSVGGSPSGWFAGGGGGGVEAGQNGNSVIPGNGGLGGGGNGGRQGGTAIIATAGSPNTGGGGGGNDPGAGGAGGSGIVIVRYQGPQKAIGGTVTTSAGHTIHTFTTVGSTTFTPLVATNNSAILGLSDLSGRGNFGTSVNGPTYSSANGGSIVFDGTNDHISIPSQFDAQSPLTGYGSFTGADTNAFTLEIWIKTSQISGANSYTAPHLIGRDNGDIYSNLTLYNGYVYFVHYNSAWLDNLKSTTMVANNVWHQVVYVNNINETGVIYVDGISEVSGSSSLSGANYFSPDYLGRGYNNRYFQGNISICKFYDRALTAAEVSQNFNALRGRFGI